MKKLIISLLLIAAPLSAFADPVSEGEAREIARSFFAVRMTRASLEDVALVWTGETYVSRPGAPARTAPSPSSVAPFYVFNYGDEGFVVVSGSDRITPVLGYSLTGPFKSRFMPDNVRYWFEYLQKQVEYAEAHDLKASAETAGEWSAPRSTRGTPVVKYETALWDQGAPYNLMCPVIDGRRTITGCTNTAMAIIMRYNEWPLAGTGVIPGYTYALGNHRWQEGHELGHAYDWESMPLKFVSGQYSDYQANQVAQLMFDLGVMFHARYEPDETGTDSGFIPDAVARHMSYKEGADHLFQDSFDDSALWLDAIKKELEYAPVFMGASLRGQNEGGHAFVIDGYDSNDYFSFNFGWSGANNGFYKMVAADSDDPDLTDYSNRQSIIINLRPDRTSQTSQLTIFLNGNISFDWDYKVNSPFTVRPDLVLANTGDGTASYDVGMALIKKSGTLKCHLSEYLTVSVNPGERMPLNVPFSCTSTYLPSDGDVITLCYRRHGTQEWEYYMTSSRGIIAMENDGELDENTSLQYNEEDNTVMLVTPCNTHLKAVDAIGRNLVPDPANRDQYSMALTGAVSPVTVTLTNCDNREYEFNIELK